MKHERSTLRTLHEVFLMFLSPMSRNLYPSDSGSALGRAPSGSQNCGLIRAGRPRGGYGGSEGENGDEGGGRGTGTATITKPKSETKTPSLYRVILMNDDYTPMDFVIHVIQKFFGKDLEEATQIMLAVHQKGAGVCGVFSHEIAETKTHQVNQYSKQNRHPLKCTMEKA
jgi:ATP-dependent Clp protease adaptor protein ClpS